MPTFATPEPINEASRSDVKVASNTRVAFADGQLSVKTTTSGDKSGSVAITIGHIAGRASIGGGAFAMRIGHASADLDLSSGRGDFDIDRADGGITATTGNGAIRIGRMTHGQAKLMNGSGNIEVGIGEGAVASIDASSERGAVHDFVSPPGNSGPPDGTVMVHARTRHGDIIIQRAAG
jgi:hypothetical protein